MPFTRTDTPTPAALAKRVRRLASQQGLAAHVLRAGKHPGWIITIPATGYAQGYGLTAEAALVLLERLAKRRG